MHPILLGNAVPSAADDWRRRRDYEIRIWIVEQSPRRLLHNPNSNFVDFAHRLRQSSAAEGYGVPRRIGCIGASILVGDSGVQFLPHLSVLRCLTDEGNAHDQFAEAIAARFGKDGQG